MLSVKNFVLYFCLVLIAGLAPSTAFAKRETGFLNRTAKIGGQEYRYQVYLPANYTKDCRWPVIVFLHGSGERLPVEADQQENGQTHEECGHTPQRLDGL